MVTSFIDSDKEVIPVKVNKLEISDISSEKLVKKLDTIIFLDGIAIFFIVLYHEFDGFPNNPLFTLNPYLMSLGLTLFTFSSGYKLMINHSDKMSQRVFLSEYYLKRFVRLYKPYFGYALLMAIPLSIISYTANHFFHLDYPEINITSLFNNMNILSFFGYLTGDNPIAFQLWYLVILIIIMSICFTILYFLNVKWLFLSFIPFFLISFIIETLFDNNTITKIFIYLPFFIFGCYWAFRQQMNQTVIWEKTTRYYLPGFFIIGMIFTFFSQNLIDRSMLIHLCCLLFPLFLILLFDHVKESKFLIPFFMFCGTYSFQIYLFQWPLTLPILSRGIIGILNIDYVFMPVLVSILAVFFCVIFYKLVKSAHLNILFE